MTRDPQFVAALAHGLEILQCFSPEQPILTNGALARTAGMPRSSVSRLTHTLVKMGYLDYDTDTGAYRLGLNVLSLQPAAIAGMRLADNVAPHMSEMANQFGARVLLTVYESYGLTVVQSACTNPDIPSPRDIGFRYAIPRRAMGRAYIATCSSYEQEKIIDHLAKGDESKSESLHTELNHAVKAYRNNDYCMSLGEGRPGNNSISVAVNMPHLGRRLMLACGGPSHRFSERVLHDRVAPQLLKSAVAIERASSKYSTSRRCAA